MFPPTSVVAQLGFAILPDFLSPSLLMRVEQALERIPQDPAVRTSGAVYAVRNLLTIVPEIHSIAMEEPLLELARNLLGPEARAVRGLLFDKSPGANWLVPWHQDLTICVKERRNADGFGPWSNKAGVQSVQPPVSILERMIAFRLHLDNTGPANGALRVLPRSHLSGRLRTAEIADWQSREMPITCSVARGGVMAMKPLLLHASSVALESSRRRTIHIEYAACSLPYGLEWAVS